MRWLLSLLVLAALLPALGLATLLAVRFADAERADFRQDGRDAARVLTAAVDRQLAAIEATLVALATSPALAAGDLDTFNAQALRLRGVAGLEIVLTDAEGRLLMNTRAPVGEALPALRTTAPYREAAASDARVVSGVFQGTLASHPIVLVLVPARFGPDEAAAALAASIDAQAISAPVLQSSLGLLPAASAMLLLDRDNRLVGRLPDPVRGVGEPATTRFAAALIAAKAGGATEGWIAGPDDPGGERVHVAWRVSDTTGWTSLAVLPDQAIGGAWRERVWPLLVGGGALLLLGLWLARWLELRLAAPLRALAGGAAPRARSGIAEVDGLAASLAATTARRAAAEASLRAGEARLRLALDHARLGYFDWDAATDRMQLSPRAAEMVGLAADASAPARAERWRMLHPDDRGSARGAWQRALTERTDYEMEYRVRRPCDGREVWIAALGRGRYADGDGAPLGMVGVIRDVTERKTSEAALREAVDRAERYFEATRTALIVLDADGILREINAAGTTLLGVPKAALLGRDWARNFVPEHDRASVLARLDAFRAGAELAPLYEGVLQRPDGEVRLVDWRTIALRDATGAAVGVFSAGEDVTERRAMADRQTLLAREVDHRARNALAVVQSVLRLTRADTAGEYARLVEGRVAALARAHKLLAEERWRAADLRSLLEQELAPFTGLAPVVTLSGPAVAVRPAAVQAVAMALHELATNAAKHGALSAPDGQLAVTWRETAAGLEIDWVERGGPPIAAEPERRGFGTRVLDATVRDQLDGAIERRWEPAGLAVSLRVPARHLVREAA